MFFSRKNSFDTNSKPIIIVLCVCVLVTYPGLEEPLQHLQLLLGPGPGVLGRHLQLQRLVVFGVERHAALEHLRLEHDDTRLIGVHNGQLQRGGGRGDWGRSQGA